MSQEPAARLNLAQFDPSERSFQMDPYPYYARLVRESPMHRIASTGAYWATRHDLVLTLFQDKRFSAKPPNASPADRLTLLEYDPPDHTRLRSLVSKAFTPRVIEGLRPHIGEIAERLLARVQAKGQMDLVEEFAFPLPAMVIAEMMGVPWEDQEQFAGWSRQFVLGSDAYQTEEIRVASQAAFQSLLQYFAGLIARRRAAPHRDDLIGNLIAAEEAGDRLSPRELVSMCILLLIAGHETTANLIANGTLNLLRHPDQLALLRARPELMESAVEELLRFESPVQRRGRWALEDLELGGVTIKQGQYVAGVISAANRDPAVFPDPDRLDITRAPNPHLAFGRGIHFCLGAPLARLEGQIAFQALLTLPDLALETSEPEWATVTTFRRLERLPVRFTPSRRAI